MFASENLTTASSRMTQNKLEGMIDSLFSTVSGKGRRCSVRGVGGKHVERPPSSAQQRFFLKKKCLKIRSTYNRSICIIDYVRGSQA